MVNVKYRETELHAEYMLESVEGEMQMQAIFMALI